MAEASWEKHRLGWISAPPWPPVGKQVQVWVMNRIRPAWWDGQYWIDAETREVLVGVEWWREERY